MYGSDKEALEALNSKHKALLDEISQVIVGQEQVIREVTTAIFAGGHVLLVGVPGLAKTLLVNTIAQSLGLSFNRVQFTPDLMPSDITGTDVLQDDPETHQRAFHFMQGPLFANIVLADEINRTPPKTQAALLEAMQERRVTVGTSSYPLPQPFFVLATQNPIEQEGTYTLPEAQLDRFMFHVVVDYPTADEELLILKQTTGQNTPDLDATLTGQQILDLQQLVRQVPVADHVFVYARDLARATRPSEPDAKPFVKSYIAWGAGPRAGQYLVIGAKARALLEGRLHATTDDVKAVAHPVLRHRIVTTFQADSENISSDDLVDMLLRDVPVELAERAASRVP